MTVTCRFHFCTILFMRVYFITIPVLSSSISSYNHYQIGRLRSIHVFNQSYFEIHLQEGGKYGELFSAALRNYGILCIGLYRFRDTSASTQSPSSKRYVITNPPDDFPLLPTDQVRYCAWQKYCLYLRILNQQVPDPTILECSLVMLYSILTILLLRKGMGTSF